MSEIEQHPSVIQGATSTNVQGLTGTGDAHHDAGVAVLQQRHIIPTTGERKVSTRWEYWSYCLFYVGASGIGPFNFAPAQFQNLIYQAFPDGTINWGGNVKSLNSMILDVNGITFAIQTFIYLVIGPYADYGNWRPYILIFFTLVSWAMGFTWMGIQSASKWQPATAIYVIGYFAYNIVWTFYQAAFPGIVRDLPQMVESEQQVVAGEKDAQDHAQLDMLERSKLANMALIFSGAGTTIVLLIGLGICYGMGTETVEQNTKVYSVLIAWFTAAWILTGTPWFYFEQYRPGQQLPKDANVITVGPRQLWQAVKCAWQLKHTLLYLASFFLINDCLNTSGTVVSLLQNSVIAFSTTKLVALFIIVFAGEAVGVFALNWVQQRFKLPAKYTLVFSASTIVFYNLWGLIGIWTPKLGFHNGWEFWAYNVWIGLGVAGWYANSVTMITEVCPAPKMYMFFALFNIVGKTSAFVGPFISSAIIDRANGNTSVCFWFLVFSGLLGIGLLLLVDVEQAKMDCAKFLEREAAERYQGEDRPEIIAVSLGDQYDAKA